MRNPVEEAPGDGALAAPDDIERLDADALRSELRKARERLALHDGFDRVIEENVRRTRQMLDAASDLRARVAGGLPPEERTRISAEVASLNRMAEAMSNSVAELVERINALQASLDSPADVARDEPETHANPILPVDTVPGSSHALDLIIHGVADAASALAIQRSLRNLNGLEDVTPREYAEGILRLRVTVAAGSDPGLHGLGESAPGLEILHRSEGVIECAVTSRPATTLPGLRTG